MFSCNKLAFRLERARFLLYQQYAHLPFVRIKSTKSPIHDMKLFLNAMYFSTEMAESRFGHGTPLG